MEPVLPLIRGALGVAALLWTGRMMVRGRWAAALLPAGILAVAHPMLAAVSLPAFAAGAAVARRVAASGQALDRRTPAGSPPRARSAEAIGGAAVATGIPLGVAALVPAARPAAVVPLVIVLTAVSVRLLAAAAAALRVKRI